jgi:serine/threonine-protein phosphatase 2A activator
MDGMPAIGQNAGQNALHPTPISFSIPQRRIITLEDLKHFHTSSTYHEIINFVSQCSQAIRGLPISHPVKVTPMVTSLVSLLDQIETMVNDTPADETMGSRFGNPSFRLFYDKLSVWIPSYLNQIGLPSAAIPEVAKYLEKSFGDRKRIDYGTGHEVNFVAFLYVLMILLNFILNAHPSWMSTPLGSTDTQFYQNGNKEIGSLRCR